MIVVTWRGAHIDTFVSIWLNLSYVALTCKVLMLFFTSQTHLCKRQQSRGGGVYWPACIGISQLVNLNVNDE